MRLATLAIACTARTAAPFEWAGGAPAFERLFVRFYSRVPHDPVLARCSSAWTRPRTCRARHETKRRRWQNLLLDCANEVGMPDDPEFRSAFVAYLGWGSRLAVINSQPGAQVDANAAMPKWGWGAVGGPYRP